MGWVAINKQYEVLREDAPHGRPVQAGEEGNLLFILQEDFGHKIAVDLLNGVLIIDYDNWEIVNNDVQLYNPKSVIYICDETTIVGLLSHMESSEPDEQGWVQNTFTPLVWRPIWFTRMTNAIATKIIGAQTTMPKEFGGKNIKKMISIFDTGALGID
jgi:hypothetical protein